MVEELPSISTIPFIDLLSYEDQKQYITLREKVGSTENRYNRNKRIQTFQEILSQIRDFCERGEDDDCKRYLVCGITWLGKDIAINTRQLRLLIIKSKSSINGAFAKMNYETVPIKGEESTALIQKIPFLKGHFMEMRQWTIRRPISESKFDSKSDTKTNFQIDSKADFKSFKNDDVIFPKPQFFSPEPPQPEFDFDKNVSFNDHEIYHFDDFDFNDYNNDNNIFNTNPFWFDSPFN